MSLRRLALLPLVLLLLTMSAPMVKSAGAVPAPVVSSPPAGLRGYPLWDSYYDLAPFGYEEQEYLVSGTAQNAVGDPAAYTTRIIVTRPADASDFNGTVLLDWVNVTAQFENAVDTMLTREMLMREGFAYVHVTAQSAGVCCTPLTPKIWDPVRYASLDHPGDDWALDMFTQVAEAFKAPNPGGLDPMGGIGAGRVRRVLATGQSQSANELADYVHAWLPTHPGSVGVIDGIQVHGNVPGEKDFAKGSPIPVLHLLSDYEAQDDGVDPAVVDPRYRLWEIAGASHADYFIGYQSVFGHGPRVLTGAAKMGVSQYHDLINAAGNYGEVIAPLLATCIVAGNTLPMHYADSAALHQLNVWVATGAAPRSGPRFQFAGGQLATDEHGNTLGGIRMPPIDVPVAQYVSTVCQLGGITVPFTDGQIQSLYPSHAAYYALMAARTDQAVADGWLLPDDAIDLMRRACAASVRFQAAPANCATYVPPAFNHVLASAEERAPNRPAPAPAVAPAGALAATGGGRLPVVPLAMLALAMAWRRVNRPARYRRPRPRRA
jgi:hypothetical protein